MNCDKIKDIIITDYTDNELDAKTRGEIELHLKSCSECSSFKEALFSGIVEPLRNTKAAEPPEYLWYKVKNNIERSLRDENSFDIGTVISSFLPRWVNVAAIISMVIFTSIAGNYFAHNIWLKLQQGPAVEASESLALGELNDMPSEQVEKIYSNIIGG